MPSGDSDVRRVLILTLYNSLQIQFAYTLKQRDSRPFDVIGISQRKRGRDPRLQPPKFMLPIHERIPPVILARIPQQIKRKEARPQE